MSKIFRPEDNETLKHWIDAIITEASDKLNEWETQFVADMAYKINRGWTLTEAQQNKLESIYAEKTS